MAERATPWQQRTAAAREEFQRRRIQVSKERHKRGKLRRKPAVPLGGPLNDVQFGGDTLQVIVMEHEFQTPGELVAPTIMCGEVDGEVQLNAQWNGEVVLSQTVQPGTKIFEEVIPVSAGDKLLVTLGSDSGAFRRTSFLAMFREG